MTDTQTPRSSTAPATITQPGKANGGENLPAVPNGEKPKVGYASNGAFELMQRAANALSKSSLVPKDYQNNIPNCMIALGIAHRIGADPMMVMQNLDVIHGRPSWRAQFMIGTANSCGRFSAIRYEFFGEVGTDSWGCRAWATEKSTGEKLIGPDVTISLAKKEDWYGKKGSKWQTMPQLMLMYRSGSWWVRAYAPELSLGFHTADEVIDILDATPQNDGSYRVDHLKQAQAMLGARQDDPAHDAETGEILDQETIDAGEGVLADEAARDAEPALDRGKRLLELCTDRHAVADLHASIKDELTEDEAMAWSQLCAARSEAVQQKRK